MPDFLHHVAMSGYDMRLMLGLACSVGEAYNTYSFSQAFKQGGSAVRRAGGALSVLLSVVVVVVLGIVFSRVRVKITGQTLFLGVLQGNAGDKSSVLREDDTKRSTNNLNSLGAAVASPSDLGWNLAMSGPTPVSQRVSPVFGTFSDLGWAVS